MTRPNITPGPWHYTKGVSPSVNSQIDRTPVNIARTIYGSHDEALANARAIAAVPALLEALENLFKRLQAIEVSKRWHEKPEEMDEAEFIRLISEEVAERGFLSEARSALTAAGYQF